MAKLPQGMDSNIVQLVAKTEAIDIDQVNTTNFVNYFLSVGLDQKGQVQSAYSAKGSGLDARVSIDPGKLIGMTLELAVDASGESLKKGLAIVSRGPRQLGGTPLTSFVVLSCMKGKVWKGGLGVGGAIGLGAEAKIGLDDKGIKTKAEEDFTKFAKKQTSDEEDAEEKAESLSASASAFIGFRADIGATADHYYAADPAHVFYKYADNTRLADREQLGKDVVAAFSDVNRKHVIRDNVSRYLNEIRAYLKPVAEKANLWKEAKATLGISSRSWTGERGDFIIGNEESNPLWVILDRLSRLNEYPQIITDLFHSDQTNAMSVTKVKERSSVLASIIAPFAHIDQYPINCWLKMWSVSAAGGASIEASGAIAGRIPGKEPFTIEGGITLAGVDFKKRRTGIFWQQAQGASAAGALYLCTQDTVIDYTTFDMSALKVILDVQNVTKAETAAFEKQLNLMAYRSAILYWSQPNSSDSPVTALEGSGYAFGQSMVVKNLLKVINAIKANPPKPSTWLKRMAARLRVSEEPLEFFLRQPNVIEQLNSLANSTQETSGDSNQRQPWGDRSVLIEASFAFLEMPTGIQYQTNKLVGFSRDIWFARPASLQALRLRFRIADDISSQKSFRLGFMIGKTGIGLAFRKIEEAGAEGIIDLHTYYIDTNLDNAFQGGWKGTAGITQEAKSVPPVTLFSQ